MADCLLNCEAKFRTVTQLQLLLFSGLAFFVMLPLMKRTLTISLDFDWFYRKLGPALFHQLIAALSAAGRNIAAELVELRTVSTLLTRSLSNLSLAFNMGMVLLVFAICLFYFLL